METKYLYPKNPKCIKYPIYPFTHKKSDFMVFLKNYRPDRCENDLQKYLQKLHKGSNIILTDSGSSALMLALKCIDIKSNEEVMLSSFNCPNVIDAVLNTGAKPVFVDIDKDFSLSIKDIKRKKNEKTKAIIFTHIYGLRENINVINWARKEGIFIIDDGAQAMFTIQNGKFAGSFGDVGLLSFGFTKQLSSIGGGALIVKNKELLCKLPKLYVERREDVYNDFKEYLKSWFISKLSNNYIFSKHMKSWNNILKIPMSCTNKLDAFPNIITKIKPKKMNKIREILIINQLKKEKLIIERNKANYSEMNECLESIKKCGVQLIYLKEGESPNYYTLIFPDEFYRYECSVYLADKGIQTCWNYVPLDLIPIYLQFKEDTKNVEYVWSRVLSIPFKYPLVSEDIQYISLQIKKFMYNINLHGYKGDRIET